MQPVDFLIRVKDIDHSTLNQHERKVLKTLGNRPKSAFALAMELDLLHPALLNTTGLEELGAVGRIGLTPTDILHAEGTYSIWNTEAAQVATEMYAKHLHMESEAFIELVRSRITEKLSTEILSRFLSETLGDTVTFDCGTCSLLLDKILGATVIPEIDFRLTVKLPSIAIGAPVATYFPSVASQLNGQLVIPEHAEVANAVGAITGSIVETVEVLIDPIYSPAGIQCYTVHSPAEKVDFDDLKSATVYAEDIAERLAKERAIHAGAGQQVEVRIEKTDQTAAEGYGGSDFLLASSIKATAVSKPNVFSDAE